jgi:CRP-like cAMP-binding protein
MTSPETPDLQALAALPLFRDLGPGPLASLLELGETRNLEAGEILLEEKSEGSGLYVILAGALELTKQDSTGKHRRLAEVGAGAVLGEVSMVLNTPCTATARAKGATQALVLNGSRVVEALTGGDAAVGRLALNLIRLLAERQNRVNRELLGMMERLAPQPSLGTELKQLETIMSEWGC